MHLSQQTHSARRGEGYYGVPPRTMQHQQRNPSFKMSLLACIALISLAIMPFAEATTMNRSHAAALSAQLAPTRASPEAAFHRKVQVQVGDEAQSPLASARATGASGAVLSPQPPASFSALWSKVTAPARHIANTVRRAGRVLLSGRREEAQMPLQRQQQQPGMRPGAPRVGLQFSRLVAEGRQPGLSPSTKGKLSELAKRYAPSDETAAAIAAAQKARAGAPAAAPAPAPAAAEGAAARGGPAPAAPKRDFTSADFQLKDISPRLKRAEAQLSKRKEEEKKEEENRKRREEERSKEKEREEERRRKEEEQRKREEEEQRKRHEEEERRKRQQHEEKQREEKQRREREEKERREKEEAKKKEEERRRKEAEEKERMEQEKRRKEEAERQKKREEDRKRKEAEERKSKEEEERRKHKEAEAKRQKEEAARKKKEEERQKEESKKKGAEASKQKEEDKKKKGAADRLSAQLKQAAQKPMARVPFAQGESQEQLLKKAEAMFAEVDEEAKRLNEFTQPPLPDLVPNDNISPEEKAAAAKPSIDPSIPKRHLERGFEVIKNIAKKYSEKENYFPGDSLKLQTAVNDDPTGGGAEFLKAVEGEIKNVSPAASEELGRLMMKNARIHIDKKAGIACTTYDTGLTARAYIRDQVVGQFGIGYKYRLRKFVDEKNECGGDIDAQVVVRPERMTMAELRQNMLERHNALRRVHSVPDLKWNPLIAANVLNYLRQQDEHGECRMEHSPHSLRNLVSSVRSSSRAVAAEDSSSDSRNRSNNNRNRRSSSSNNSGTLTYRALSPPGIKDGIGENLYTACSVGQMDRDVPGQWGSEAHCYRYGRVGNPCTGVMGPKCSIEYHASGLMTGHYTATVWNKSREMGCAYVICKRKCEHDRPIILVGCQYSPAGNVVGQEPFPKESATKVSKEYTQMLPAASEDPVQVKKCEAFMEEMQRKNPRVDISRRHSI
ncbi:hypothetical protein, conserved [Eimeria brunetti]|uniref:SCP domain-containing protein n=1 Tax=Eimeria brunetti TaxID=51314 RepID=U6L9B8_9EIME|nr:hypothetical protein, conserved [Eimeria brunetti]